MPQQSDRELALELIQEANEGWHTEIERRDLVTKALILAILDVASAIRGVEDGSAPVEAEGRKV